MNDNPVRLSEPERDRTAVDRRPLQTDRLRARCEHGGRSKGSGSNFEACRISFQYPRLSGY